MVDGRFFKMTRLLFGLKPSPSGMTQAAATVIHRARAQIPTPATTFGISVYIDDVLVGADVRETCSNTFNRVLRKFATLTQLLRVPMTPHALNTTTQESGHRQGEP